MVYDEHPWLNKTNYKATVCCNQQALKDTLKYVCGEKYKTKAQTLDVPFYHEISKDFTFITNEERQK